MPWDKAKNGIVLLQETHSSVKDESKWRKEWGEDLYLNHGSNNSRGTLIAFSNEFDKNAHMTQLKLTISKPNSLPSKTVTNRR